MINRPIEMPCEEGSMSVVPTNKAKEAVGVMQDEVDRLEKQLAKANERVKELEAKEQLTTLTTHEATLNSDYGKKWLNKFALEQKLDAIGEAIEYCLSQYPNGAIHSLNEFREQLRKEQEK
jgi:Na+/phosphate symporter